MIHEVIYTVGAIPLFSLYLFILFICEIIKMNKTNIREHTKYLT
jgi:hypothetical protein